MQRPIDLYRKLYSGLNGFFTEPQAIVWDFMLTFQTQQGICGNTMEIGVMGGRSATLMAMHTKLEERAVFADLQIPDVVRRVLDKEHPKNNIFFEGRSSNLRAQNLQSGEEPFFRFIHIDGGHSGTELMSDLRLADTLLHDAGVICIDDFFSPAYPQITDAVFRYLAANPYSLSLVLVGLYKGFLVRPLAARDYLTHIDQALLDALYSQDCKLLHLSKTTHPDEINCFGLHWADGEASTRRGPDWDPGNIVY